MPDVTFRKLLKLKKQQGYEGKPWSDWFRYLTRTVSLNERFDDAVGRNTRSGLAPLWMENFIMNLPEIVDLETYPRDKDKHSIGRLPKHKGRPALIVAAGPSVEEKHHLELLAERGFKGVIFACDRMLIPLLKNGVVPNYVVSVDGNREKIVRWFDDPIVDRYAKRVTGLFVSTAAPNAVRRFKQAGGRIYWFHGMLDPFYELDSVTSFMNYMTGSTAVSCGGNVGTSCWTLAYYLKCSPIIFIGLDLGYTKETPIEETAYYELLKSSGAPLENIQQFYEEGVNPEFGCEYYTDAVFKNYRDSLLEMVEAAGVETINATEGGCVFGPGIRCMRFEEVLERYGADNAG
ncbi:MAG: DUF115 domain-containing protein [Deltaproteobacteria bacterium]|nr:DUF115 domain-containing protein [Deltaproteobacteria bacterium]